jgi:hypothetical protein
VLLAFAVLYLPLEEFLLKWLPVDATGYALLRLAFEGVLVAAALALAAGHIVRTGRLGATPLDGPLLLFALLASASLAASEGSWLRGALNLRVLLRYVAVFYLAAYLGPGARERRRLLVLLLAGGAFQALLGIAQHLAGGASEFWLPRAERLEVLGLRREFAAAGGGLERGAALGTTDHSVAFALLLLVTGTLAASAGLAGAARTRAGRLALGGTAALAALGILASYARACLFAYALALVVLAWRERRGAVFARLRPWLLLATPLGLAALLIVRGAEAGFVREREVRVDPLASVSALFTREYLATAEASRLWVLCDVGAEVVRSAGWLGFGPDEEHAKRELMRTGGAALQRLAAYRAFEDVYWVALFAYYGFLGAGAFLFLLLRLGVMAWRVHGAARDGWERAAAGALAALWVALLPLSFLAPTLDFRTFAFPLWLLAGLSAGASAAEPGAAAARARAGILPSPA